MQVGVIESNKTVPNLQERNSPHVSYPSCLVPDPNFVPMLISSRHATIKEGTVQPHTTSLTPPASHHQPHTTSLTPPASHHQLLIIQKPKPGGVASFWEERGNEAGKSLGMRLGRAQE